MWDEIKKTQADLDTALAKAKERGLLMNKAEAHYYTVKDERVRELMEEGKSGTVISMIIKGEPDVCEAMKAYHDYQVLYRNAQEAINVYKRRLDTLREEYEREWSRAGQSY